MIKVLIVDDEPLARENLRVFLQEQSDIEIVGECSNAVEGIGAVHKLRPDVLFLDIQMPRISGLEMVGMLDPEHRPYIVFLTAFDEYAIKAFEEHAFDYLLKPLNPDRMRAVLEKAFQEISEERLLASQKEEMRKQLDITLPIYMEQQLNQWVYGRLSAADRKEIEKIIPCGKPGNVVITRLKGFQEWGNTVEKEEMEETKYRIKWWVKELLQLNYHSLSFFSHVLPDTMVTVVTLKRAGSAAADFLAANSDNGKK